MSFDPIQSPDQLVENDDLIGSLRVANPFDLSQFLLLNKKSGTLTLFRRGGTTRLFFVDGRIVNGVEEPGGKQGRAIAIHALTLKEGGFRFREETPETAHLVEDTTQNLLLEAAKAMDEAAEAAGDDSPGMQEQLREKQEQTEALNQVFAMLEKEVASDGETPPLDTMLERFAATKGARLYLEAGSRPRVLQGGRVTHTLDGTVTEDVLREAVNRAADSGVLTAGSVRYQVDHDWHGGRVTLSPIRKPIDLAQMNLDSEAVEALLARRGRLLLLTGDTPDVASQLHGCVLAALAKRGDAVIQIGEWRARGDAGLVMPVPHPEDAVAHRRIRAMVGRLRPAWLAFPEVRTDDDAALAHGTLLAGHGAVITMTGRDGGDAVGRFVAWMRSHRGESAWIANMLGGVISVRVGAGRDGSPFALTSVARAGEDSARALAQGDFAALAAALERSAGDHGFHGSLRRLVAQKKLGEDDAKQIAPNLPQALSIDPGI